MTHEVPLNGAVIQKVVSLAADKARINKHVTPHTLRHSYATGLLEAGVDLMAISKLLGHSSFTTTMIYLHCRKQHLSSTPSPLDWLPVKQCPLWVDPSLQTDLPKSKPNLQNEPMPPQLELPPELQPLQQEQQPTVYNSCGDRICPQCSGARRSAWLDKTTKLIEREVTYFQVVVIDWVVVIQGPPKQDCGGELVLKCLTRYMTGGPISDKRIIKEENGRIFYWVRNKDKSGG